MSAPDETGQLRVLVTGATGYVGSRLIPELLAAGHHVLAATRSSSGLDDYPWRGDVEPQELDVDDEASVAEAVTGVDAVVYLVHSMDDNDFVEQDRKAARRVATACEQAGVSRIVYLSGLIPPDDSLSDHLRSRFEVERVFLDCDVPTVVLRAAMVIGAGSTSFDLLRRLSERVPVITPIPAWMRNRLQPVAVEDVVYLIVRALRGEPRNDHYDVGGDDVLTYPELLAAFAEVAGLRRRRFLVPWVPRAVVARGCTWISGMPHATVSALVDSLCHEMVCLEDRARRDLAEADHQFMGVREALDRSLNGHGDGASRAGDVQAASIGDSD